MALRQQPNHVVVPRLANVRARPITLFQLLNAEMIRHVRHARPLRFIAHQANCFAPPRESADSISRKPYNIASEPLWRFAPGARNLGEFAVVGWSFHGPPSSQPGRLLRRRFPFQPARSVRETVEGESVQN